MKCPCCGHEMYLDSHRKIDMYMCYDCGYIEGRKIEAEKKPHITNFERLRSMNMNETIAFMSRSLGVDESSLAAWMDSTRVGA